MKICEYCGHIMSSKQDMCTVCGNATSIFICACCEKKLPDPKSNYCSTCKLDKTRVAKAALVIARRSSKDMSALAIRSREKAENTIKEAGSDFVQKAMNIMTSEDFYEDMVKIKDDFGQVNDSISQIVYDFKRMNLKSKNKRKK